MCFHRYVFLNTSRPWAFLVLHYAVQKSFSLSQQLLEREIKGVYALRNPHNTDFEQARALLCFVLSCALVPPQASSYYIYFTLRFAKTMSVDDHGMCDTENYCPLNRHL